MALASTGPVSTTTSLASTLSVSLSNNLLRLKDSLLVVEERLTFVLYFLGDCTFLFIGKDALSLSTCNSLKSIEPILFFIRFEGDKRPAVRSSGAIIVGSPKISVL